jgi:peptide-methionine (S)-S-oxide reductase
LAAVTGVARFMRVIDKAAKLKRMSGGASWPGARAGGNQLGAGSMSQTGEIATLGGGCFWCLEAVFLGVDGVTAVESGYAGGQVDRPTYEQVCDGVTGHAEVVKVEFDPARIGYREILDIFFAIHDPTQLNRQGNDVGTQYRSVIFTHSDAQRETALQAIREIAAEGIYDGQIVTQVLPLDGNYWPAEAYHQNYFAQHPNQGYCSFVVAPKVAKFRQKFAHRVKAG